MSNQQTRKQANGRSKASQGNRPQKQQKNKSPGRSVAKPTSPGKLSSAPVAMGRQSQTRKPMMRTAPNGDCHIHHREYLKDLVAQASSPSLFTSLGFPINPGMASTFPWLSQIAPRFEKYRFNKLRFDFETEAPTSLGGSLILTVDYDASDPAPTSKVQAMAYKNAVRSAPWEECCHTSAKEDLSQQKQYFVRSGAVPPGSDIKLYDVGNLFACSQNVVTGGATLGELYVDYDILLQTPQLQLPSGSDIDSVLVTGNGVTPPSPAIPFGSGPTFLYATEPPLVLYNGGTGFFTFQRAVQFGLAALFQGTVFTAITFNGTLGASLTNNASSLIDGGALDLIVFSSPGVQAQIGDTFQMVVTGTTVTASNLTISELAV